VIFFISGSEQENDNHISRTAENKNKKQHRIRASRNKNVNDGCAYDESTKKWRTEGCAVDHRINKTAEKHDKFEEEEAS
jgi:hypothetical protein